MSKVEKSEGATMDCGSCGRKLICRSKTYPASANYKEKTVLQWQNESGTPHYKWIKDNTFKCVDSDGKDIPAKKKEGPKVGNGLIQNDLMKDEGSQSAPEMNSPQITQSKGRDKKDDQELDEGTAKIVINESTLLYKIRKIVTKTLKEFEDDPHGGMIGQFTEIIYKKHFGEKAHE